MKSANGSSKLQIVTEQTRQSVEDLCRDRTNDAVQALVDLMRSTDKKVALEAAKEILVRGWGRVPETKEQDTGGARAMELAELLKALPAALRALQP